MLDDDRVESWTAALTVRWHSGCFVAMWFDESMNDAFEIGISKAVTDRGFPTSVRIDRKEHNSQITDEIIAAIRDAEFAVADFKDNRGGI